MCFPAGLHMNVALETQPNCLAKLRVELPPDRVARERASLAIEFQRQARIPGYRPGKAPKALIETRFAKQIGEELNSKLVRESLSEAIKEKSLKVLSIKGVSEVTLGADDVLRYEATVVTEPEFQLPDYSSIPCDAVRKEILPEDVDSFLEQLRDPHATFEPIEGRPAALGDYAVATYTASLDGKPLEEAVPGAPPQLCGRRNAWILLNENSLAPGFCKAFVGMNVGQEKTFEIPLPEDFSVPQLMGKTLTYSATLHALNAKALPPLDDALADKIDPGSTVETLREKLKESLEANAEREFAAQKREAAIRHLLSQVDCELPESAVAHEMRGILQQVVRENQMRGISDEEIQSHQDELLGSAQRSARDRVRGNFLLLRIADKEHLEATESDLTALVLELAHRYEIPVKKFVADLKKRGGIEDLRDQVLARKALDLLAANVTLQSNPASPTSK